MAELADKVTYNWIVLDEFYGTISQCSYSSPSRSIRCLSLKLSTIFTSTERISLTVYTNEGSLSRIDENPLLLSINISLLNASVLISILKSKLEILKRSIQILFEYVIISYLIVEVRSDADSAIDEEALLLNCRECNSRSSLYFLRSPDELHEEEVIRIIFLGNLEDYFVLIPLLVDIHVFTFETLQGNCSEFIFRVINLYSTLNVSSWNFLSCTVLNSITFVGLNSESIVLVSIPNVPFFLIVSCQLLIKCLERELQITNCIIRITVVSNCIISIEFSQNDSLEVNLYLEVTDRSNIVILVEQSHANNTNLTNVGIRSTFYNLSLNDTSVLVDSESFSRLIVLAILNKSVLIVEASFLQLTVRSSIFVKKLPLMSILVCTIIAIRTDILSKFKLFTSVCNLESQTSVTICLGTRSSQERKCKIVFLMCFISIYGLTNLQSLIIIINNTSVVRRNHTCRLTFTCS